MSQSAARWLAIAAILLLIGLYLAVRWADPNACPGLQALDPTCVVIRD